MLKEPELPAPTFVRFDQHGMAVIGRDPEAALAPLEEEAVFRLVPATDPADPDALLDLASEIGNYQLTFRMLDAVRACEVLFPLKSAVGERITAWQEQHRRTHLSATQPFVGEPVMLDAVPVDALAFSVEVFTGLVSHLHARHVGDSDMVAIWPEPLRPATDWQSRAMFKLMMDAGLEAFSPQVEDDVDLDPPLDVGLSDRYEPANVLVAQIYNAMTAKAPVKRCETCGKFFVRQLGKDYGQAHRTGVKYCTNACGNRSRNSVWRAKQRGLTSVEPA